MPNEVFSKALRRKVTGDWSLNRSSLFSTDAEEVKAKMEEFSTFQRPFSQEKIEFVLEVAKDNIKNNKETLLREINKAVLRQHNKR